MAAEARPVALPGISEDLRADIEDRVFPYLTAGLSGTGRRRRTRSAHLRLRKDTPNGAVQLRPTA